VYRYEFAIRKSQLILNPKLENYVKWLNSDPGAKSIVDIEIPLLECMRLSMICLDSADKEENPNGVVNSIGLQDCDFLDGFAKPCSIQSRNTDINNIVSEIMNRNNQESSNVDLESSGDMSELSLDCDTCIELKKDLMSLASLLTTERTIKHRLETSKTLLFKELEDLTTNLFEQANEMVSKESLLRRIAEKELQKVTGIRSSGTQPINGPDFVEFKQHFNNVSPPSAFLKRALREDIEPCLFPRCSSTSASFRRNLMDVVRIKGSLQLEPNASKQKVSCCNCSVFDTCEYKIQFTKAAHPICSFCLNRIDAVSEFFLFVEEMHGKTGDGILVLFRNMLALKKRMADARIGNYSLPSGGKGSWENIKI
jgi:hypothetical protein